MASGTVFASIVVPTARRPERLLRALGSLRAQTLADWEALVVDDGDGEGIAAAAGLHDERIRGMRNAGRGLADARLTAVAHARGRVLCWLDDDDWWDDPGHLALLREATADGRARRFCFRGGWIVEEASGAREVYDHDATPQSLERDNTVLTSSIAYPRALHEELGPLDRELGGYCDWDFLLRMCAAGVEPHRLPGLGVCYAIHAGNVSSEYDAPARRASFERFRAKHGLDVVIANHVTIHRMLSEIPEGWSEEGGALVREFELPGFPAAIAFVNRVAELAEAESHHPDIDVRWRRVTLRWRTHSAGGITQRDRELARRSAELA